MTRERKRVTRERKRVSRERKRVTRERKRVTRERKRVTRERKRVARERKRVESCLHHRTHTGFSGQRTQYAVYSVSPVQLTVSPVYKALCIQL